MLHSNRIKFSTGFPQIIIISYGVFKAFTQFRLNIICSFKFHTGKLIVIIQIIPDRWNKSFLIKLKFAYYFICVQNLKQIYFATSLPYKLVQFPFKCCFVQSKSNCDFNDVNLMCYIHITHTVKANNSLFYLLFAIKWYTTHDFWFKIKWI